MFLHERGAYNTLYFTAYFGSLMVRSFFFFLGLTNMMETDETDAFTS